MGVNFKAANPANLMKFPTKGLSRIGRLLRLSPHEKATCHILCYSNSVDMKWVDSALSTFDQDKIKYYNPLER